MLQALASVVVRRGPSRQLGGWILATALLAACGQKGPLTLPKAVPGTAAAPASSPLQANPR